MSGEARIRMTHPGLARFAPDVQRRVREAWNDPEILKGDILERFKMPASCFEILKKEIGPRPVSRQTIRAGFKLRSFALGPR